MSAFTTLGSKQLNLYQVGEVKIDGLTMYYICKGGQRYTVECADQSELDARLLEISNFGKGGGGSITVDSVLSTTSTNPVQNRVITNTLIDKENLGIEITQSEYDDLVTAGTLESDVNYYITDSPSVESEMTNLGTYSTNEINTGEVWINNKPIYRKVFYSATNWENNSIIGTVSNVDTVIKLNSIAKVTGANVYCSDYTNGEDVNLAAFSKDTNQLMVTRGGFFNNSEESHVIIEYTKITD